MLKFPQNAANQFPNAPKSMIAMELASDARFPVPAA